MTAESLEQSQQAFQTSAHSIDAYHQAFKKDTRESGERLEQLVGLDRLNEL